ncbi:MAG: 2-oxoacid:acceptor oxidoreductase family protein [Nanoarchaeota archaeon]
MRLNLLIGGKAGQGINKLAEIISSSLVRAGWYVFNYKDYQSAIKGGHNFNLISISDQNLAAYEEDLDLLFAFDAQTYDEHKKNISKKTILATADSELNKKVGGFFLDLSQLGKFGNMAFAGFLFKCLGLDKKFLLEEIEKEFKQKEIVIENKKIIEQFYAPEYSVDLKLPEPQQNEPQHQQKKELPGYSHLSGSEAISQAAVEAGLEIYFGYPMTPSTGVLSSLALKQKENKDLFVFTPENEIAVINSALGASFAGRKVMVGTSGGGFDLMSEAMSLQGMVELPLVIHLSQRAGPGTGVPTYSGQGDLNAAIYAGHGEFPRLVVAPGDAQEAYEKTIEAFYLAEKFKLLSIILTDKHLAESGYTDQIKKSSVVVPKREDLLSQGVVKKNSYEHDLFGNTTEIAAEIKENTDRRIAKTKLVEKETQKFTRYKFYGTGKNLLIGFGSTKGGILDALPNLPEFSYLHLIYLEPFPSEIIAYLQKAKKILVIEQNSTGQLADLLSKQLAVTIPEHNRILKYDGRPFTAKDLLGRIK